jgi:ribonuclease Z
VSPGGLRTGAPRGHLLEAGRVASGGMAALTFLGTGSFLAPDRYWNSFVLDGRILVEPSPSVLANLRKAGFSAGAIETVVISHFHPDHTFGWPFLALELVECPRTGPLHVVGPPGVAGFLAEMMRLGSVESIQEKLHDRVDVQYVEADGTNQHAGDLALQAFEVTHVPRLKCFGYVLEVGGHNIGYSGDTEPCEGLERIAARSEVLVLECAEVHRTPTHMDVEAVADLHARHPGLRIILSHMGAGVELNCPEGVEAPDDFVTLEVP